MKNVYYALLSLVFLTSCTFEGEKKKVSSPGPQKISSVPQQRSGSAGSSADPSVDKSTETLNRYLEQADAVHREIWRILAQSQLPVGKTPFGKVNRAFLANEGVKLSNKSQFSCDNYSVKKNKRSQSGYPQDGEVYEVCNRKEGAKRIAGFAAKSDRELELTFYPENLRDVLGLGPTVVGKSVHCQLKASDSFQLESITCSGWNQDKSSSEMLGFERYEYRKNGENVIFLKGKVYKDLTDVRSIEVSVPQKGNIKIKEIELYAPEPEVKVTTTPPKPPPRPPKQDDTHRYLREKSQRGAARPEPPPMVLPDNHGIPTLPEHGHELIPLEREEGMDPDVMQQQDNIGTPEGTVSPDQPVNPDQPYETGEDFELPAIDENGELRER